MKNLSLILILLISSCSYKAKVLRCVDGDSFYIEGGKEIRIWGADCPEWTRGHNQPFGNVATKFTRQLIEGKEVTLIVKAHDRYHREVDKVILADGSDLSLLLIKAGLAFTYDKYDPQSYCNEERKAKYNHVGLWAQSGYIQSPYLFRKQFKK
ncbi:MAG: thermonuclease family protein [Ferruginibacter sp.]